MGGGSPLYKNLLDIRLHFASSRTKHFRISRHCSQMHQRQSLALNLLNHHAQYLLLGLLVLWQKNQTCAVLTLFGHGDTL